MRWMPEAIMYGSVGHRHPSMEATSAMCWAKTVGRSRYHDLGGRREENASLATHGAYVLGRVVIGDDGW